MNVSIQKLPESRIELTVEIPTVDFDKYLDKAVESLSKNLEIKGFRKGFVPKEMAKTYLAQKDIIEEAANLAINDTYPRAIEENKIEAIDSPKVEILKIASGNPLTYKATVSVLPEITLPDYKKISEKINEKNKKDFEKNTKVEEKEVDDALSWLQKSRAKYITVNREVGVGDFVKLSSKINPLLQLADGGQSPESEEHEGIIGDGYFLPDFEKNLIGMKAGEQKTFLQEIPATHANKEAAGKSLNFEVKMDLIQEVKLPELNDGFIKAFGNFENLAALRRNISESLKIEKEEKEKQKNRQELTEAIVKESRMEIPEILVERRADGDFFRLQKNLEDSGLNFQQYLENLKKTEEDLKKDLRPAAQNQVKIALTLRQISKAEEIKVSEEEIKEKVDEHLKRFSGTNDSKVDQNQLKLYYEDVIKNEKTFQLLETL